MICFVFSRVDGVLRGPRSVLLSLLGLVDGAPGLGSHLRVARRGPRRHHSRLALRIRAALSCFINPQSPHRSTKPPATPS